MGDKTHVKERKKRRKNESILSNEKSIKQWIYILLSDIEVVVNFLQNQRHNIFIISSWTENNENGYCFILTSDTAKLLKEEMHLCK